MANNSAKKLGIDSQKKAKGGQAKKSLRPSRHSNRMVADPNKRNAFKLSNEACWHMYGCPECSSYRLQSPQAAPATSLDVVGPNHPKPRDY